MIAAHGSLSKMIESLELLFASSATFQQLTELGPEQLADQKIITDYALIDGATTKDLRDLRPFIVIAETEYTDTVDSTGASGGVKTLPSGSLEVYITANALHAGSTSPVLLHKESKRDFTNFAGSMLDDVMAAAGIDDNFYPSSRTMSHPSVRTEVEHRSPENDFWETAHIFEYGIEAG